MKMKTADAAAWLAERDGFLLITHRRPDGDTICSAAALARGLRAVGKTAFLFPNPEITERYADRVKELLAPDGYEYGFIVSVDTASEGQLPPGAAELAKDVGLCVDHHMSNTGYAENTCCYPEKSSCGEVVYEILLRLCGKIEAEIASLLYIAVSTDTGCFAYANTTAETHRCAALLIEAGADCAALNKEFFRTKARKRVELEGMVLAALEYWFGGRVCVAKITRAMLARTGASENDMEDIASLPGQMEGALAGVTLKELPDGTIKVSVRTVQGTDANALCTRFGGGGHYMASGCTIAGSMDEVSGLLKKAIGEIWDLA